jgi:hypothetical protein
VGDIIDPKIFGWCYNVGKVEAEDVGIKIMFWSTDL